MSFKDLIVRQYVHPVEIASELESKAHRLLRLAIYNGDLTAIIACTGEIAWGIVEEGEVNCPDCIETAVGGGPEAA